LVPPLAKVEPLDSGAVAVVRVSGELDLENVDEIHEALLELVPNSANGLVADLSNLTYVDSAGVRLLVEISEELTRNRQQLALVVPQQATINRIFSLIKLNMLVPIHETIAAATAALADPETA
jgi:anti-sigma B factor antagonist